MESPCFDTDSLPMWAFVVVAVLSHARGTALLMREAALFLGRFTNGWRQRRRARKRRY